MKEILYDQYRFTGKWSNHVSFSLLITNRAFRRLYYYRILSKKNSVLFNVFRMLNYLLSKKMSLELPHTVNLGKGTLFLHPYSITFMSRCVIGNNFTICKGATIGYSQTGNEGYPIIGDNVYVGINSTVVGGIHIGNDVMIAANTFVNFDVPDGALVLGSPGVIHKKEKASLPYIANSITNIKTQETNI